MSKIIEQALEWADVGVPVFPCNSSKRPITPNGHLDASSDHETVTELFSGVPDTAFIGGRMGRDSKLFVLDFDLYKGDSPHEYYNKLNDAGMLPATRVHKTLSGGIHVFYKHPSEWPNVVPASGVEVKGEGGYVILPPSKGYEVESTGVAVAPEELIQELLHARRKAAGSSIDALKMQIISAEEFHDPLRMIAAKRSAQGWDVTAVVTELRDTLAASAAIAKTHIRHDRWVSLMADKSKELHRIVESGADKFSSNSATDSFREAIQDKAEQLKITAEKAGFKASPPQGSEPAPVKQVADYGDEWPFEGSGYFAHEDHDLLNQTYVMYPFFAEEETTVLFAEPKVGKTAWNLTAAFYIACGMNFGDSLRVTESRPCLYYALEGSRAIKLRIAALRRQMADDGVELPEKIPLFVVERPVNFLKEETRNEACNQIIAANNYCIKDTGKGLGFISFDTLTKAMSGGDQNSVEDTSALFELVGMLRQAGVTASIVFVHHKSRTGGVRGSTNIEAEPDVLLDVSRNGTDIIIKVDRARSIEDGGKYIFGTKSYELGKTNQDIMLTSFTVYPKDAIEPAQSDIQGAVAASRALDIIVALGEGTHPLSSIFSLLDAEGLAPESAIKKKGRQRKPQMNSAYIQTYFEDLISATGRVYRSTALTLKSHDRLITAISVSPL